MTIRLQLDVLMRARHLTIRQLARQTGISTAAISEWRTNKVSRISLATLGTLCAALECEPGDLLIKTP